MNNLPKRKSLRLKHYDYSQAGYYFVTICVQNKKNILCDIVGDDARVIPSAIGEEIIKCWDNISLLNENVKTDLFCLMPNHIHGIIIIENEFEDIEIDKRYGFEIAERRGHRSLQGIIKDFKSVTTRKYNKMVDELQKNTLWEKSFFDHVIRDERGLQKIREYIINNPLKWKLDKYYN